MKQVTNNKKGNACSDSQDVLPFQRQAFSLVSLYCLRHWKRRHIYGKTRTKGIPMEWLPQTESASNHAIVATYIAKKKTCVCINQEKSHDDPGRMGPNSQHQIIERFLK